MRETKGGINMILLGVVAIGVNLILLLGITYMDFSGKTF